MDDSVQIITPQAQMDKARFSQLEVAVSNFVLEVKAMTGNGARIHDRCQIVNSLQAMVGSITRYGEHSFKKSLYTLDALERLLAYAKKRIATL